MANVDKVGTSVGPFLLTVDYDISLAEMVVAGNYHFIYPLITEEHFPVGCGERDIESFVVHFHHSTSSDNVVNEMERHDLRPATTPELLALGAQHTNLQCESPILALGSIWNDPDGFRRVVRILGRPSDRRLDLARDHGAEWSQFYHFLAVQKRVCETLPFAMDNSKSLAAMVKAGKYSYLDRGVPDTVPDVATQGTGTEAVLVHLGIMDNAEVLLELRRRGLRPGTIRELAAFGEQYPERQRLFPILALGSVIHHRRVGCLWLNGDKRAFRLSICRHRWAGNYRFLAFKISSGGRKRIGSADDEDRLPSTMARPLDSTLEWIGGSVAFNPARVVAGT